MIICFPVLLTEIVEMACWLNEKLKVRLVSKLQLIYGIRPTLKDKAKNPIGSYSVINQ